jgi:hypothetical protein
MFAIVPDDGSGPMRHFIFAALYYGLGVVLLVVLCLTRGSIKWRGGIPASLITQILFVAMFFICGTVSLGSGLGWNFVVAHGDALELVALGLVLVAGAYDRFVYHRDY